jgi:hypothetical protein
MKLARFGAILYLTFLLWLLLFPPWGETTYWRLRRPPNDPAVHLLGHHWRFAIKRATAANDYDWVFENGADAGNTPPTVSYPMLAYEASTAAVFVVLLLLLIDLVWPMAAKSRPLILRYLRRQIATPWSRRAVPLVAGLVCILCGFLLGVHLRRNMTDRFERLDSAAYPSSVPKDFSLMLDRKTGQYCLPDLPAPGAPSSSAGLQPKQPIDLSAGLVAKPPDTPAPPEYSAGDVEFAPNLPSCLALYRQH